MNPEVEFAHDQDDMILHMPFLERLARESRVIVEIGAGHGNGSTRAFVRGLDQVDITHAGKFMISVDIDPERPQLQPQVPWWSVVHGDSREEYTFHSVRNRLWNQGWNRADVIFIDTVHTLDYLLREIALWQAIAGPGTVWCFHDTWMFGYHNGMNDAIYGYCASGEWKFIDLTHESHGLGLMVHRTNQREFQWP